MRSAQEAYVTSSSSEVKIAANAFGKIITTSQKTETDGASTGSQNNAKTNDAGTSAETAAETDDAGTSAETAAETAAQSAVVAVENGNASDSDATVSNPADQTAGSSDVIVHITRTGEKYHSAGCQYLRKSDIEVTLSEAIARGLTPCSKCNPPQ